MCNDCSGILMCLLHIGGRMLLVANTKLVRVLWKLFLLNTKDTGGKVLGSILFRILGQSLFQQDFQSSFYGDTMIPEN